MSEPVQVFHKFCQIFPVFCDSKVAFSGFGQILCGSLEARPLRVDEYTIVSLSQKSWSVLSPLIGPVYLDPRGTTSGPENVMFTVVVFLNSMNE